MISFKVKLQIIEKYAFNRTLIECITIPSQVVKLDFKWCQNTKLNKVIVIPYNLLFKSHDNGQMIIGKTSIESPKFDCLVFCILKAIFSNAYASLSVAFGKYSLLIFLAIFTEDHLFFKKSIVLIKKISKNSIT